MSDSNTQKKGPPKGGRKGGTVFPRVALDQAVTDAKKLVSKTHTGPQPESVILPGVFGNAGPEGSVRASALRQYGLLEGKPEAFSATTLAQEINGATDPELPSLLRKALLAPKVFKGLYDTFHGDTVSEAKLRQQALKLKVHPESAGECASLFSTSCIAAGIASKNGENLNLSTIDAASVAARDPSDQSPRASNVGPGTQEATNLVSPATTVLNDAEPTPGRILQTANRSGVSLNIAVDASLDAEKLEKQLELLRKYGLI